MTTSKSWLAKSWLIRNLAVIGVGFGCVLFAEGVRGQIVQSTNTQRVEFATTGTLRLKNSVGEVRVVGWDRPELEITTVKSTKKEYESQKQGEGAQELEKVRIAVERHGEEVAIQTDFPRYGIFAPPMRGDTRFNLEYEIKVPHRARIYIDHDDGDVYVENVSGDMHVTIGRGQITLLLPPEGEYAIDAKAKVGGVRSDLPGEGHRTFLLVGHEFANPRRQRVRNSHSLIEWLVGREPVPTTPPDTIKLFLRVGSGDIVVNKRSEPSFPSSVPK